ncbi:MAG TPA: hypothetical protein PK771_03780 [Spirochaetota bacterium]|nr:hypothetical protein [Spirochaetota bacterium]
MDYSNYNKHFNDKGINNFERDGAMDDQIWNNQTIKILFILKETYGYQNCNTFDLNTEVKFWLEKNNQTYTKISNLSLLLHKVFDKKRLLTNEEYKIIKPSIDDKFNAIKKCAIINLKKTSGNKKSNNNQIIRNFLDNISILKEQINNLKPNIVIAGSTVCWNCLSDKKIGLFKNEIGDNVLNKHQCNFFNGIVFYHANHPSSWGYG